MGKTNGKQGFVQTHPSASFLSPVIGIHSLHPGWRAGEWIYALVLGI
jgi:hypothetical protein